MSASLPAIFSFYLRIQCTSLLGFARVYNMLCLITLPLETNSLAVSGVRNRNSIMRRPRWSSSEPSSSCCSSTEWRVLCPDLSSTWTLNPASNRTLTAKRDKKPPYEVVSPSHWGFGGSKEECWIVPEMFYAHSNKMVAIYWIVHRYGLCTRLLPLRDA